MTYSVYQHWDPLKVCVVGRSYAPEFYSWITVPHVRTLFEKIAIETEEDYQAIIKKLQEFGVEIVRPELVADPLLKNNFLKPPMTPRDLMVMIGSTFYNNTDLLFKKFYNKVKDPLWPVCNSFKEFTNLPNWIKNECEQLHNFSNHFNEINGYEKIFANIHAQGNTIRSCDNVDINGSMITRIGQDLYIGTDHYDIDQLELRNLVDKEFTQTRNHIVNTGGHSDGVFCPVCPGLIVSLTDVSNYLETFPEWEVVYLQNQSWDKIQEFSKLKEKNQGRWWIPGFEHDQDVVDLVETWLKHWTGYVEETVFDVNMLIIDPKNVMVTNYNKQVFDAFDRYGITAHIVPFRHRYFWDGGLHCITSDLHREGVMQDYFPGRNQ